MEREYHNIGGLPDPLNERFGYYNKYRKYKIKYNDLKYGGNGGSVPYDPQEDGKHEGWLSAIIEWQKDFRQDGLTVYYLMNPKGSCFEIRNLSSKEYGRYVQLNEGCLDKYGRTYEELLDFINEVGLMDLTARSAIRGGRISKGASL
jgi:hypothetical protein